MVADIIVLVWLIGWVLAVYPIYRAILRPEAREAVANSKGLSDGAPAGSAAIATLAGLLWPLVLPFFASYFLHQRRVFQTQAEISGLLTDAHAELVQGKMHERAAIEVETSLGMNMVLVPARYSGTDYDEPMHYKVAEARHGKHNVEHFQKLTEEEVRQRMERPALSAAPKAKPAEHAPQVDPDAVEAYLRQMPPEWRRK